MHSLGAISRSAVLAAVLLLVLGGAAPAALRAAEPLVVQRTSGAGETPSSSWESIATGQPEDSITSVRAFAGETVLAHGKQGLWRSDDRGLTWTLAVATSADGVRGVYLSAIDPSDLSTMYAVAAGGLAKTVDGGATWTTVYETRELRHLARSPADPELLYLGINTYYRDFRLLRSRDGGATWEEIYAADTRFAGSCGGWSIFVLAPHPTDSAQVFWSADCVAGRDSAYPLQVSTDQGTTWTKAYETESGGQPDLLVAVPGSTPQRFYLVVGDIGTMAASNSSRAILLRSNDGAHWKPVFEYRASWLGANGQVRFSIPAVAAAAARPNERSAVYVAVNQVVPSGSRNLPATTVSRIFRGRVDPGLDPFTFWESLEPPGTGQVYSLSLSPDSQYLYAATERGLWRLPDPANQKAT